MNSKRNIVIAVVVIAIAVIAYYRFYPKPPESRVADNLSDATKELVVPELKEVSALAVYPVPGGEDKVRFVLALDGKGVITGVKSIDTIKPDEVNPNLVKFNDGLSLVIKGKKLSEINGVDKIGTSSLTTDAFNKALTEIKAQI